MIITDEMVDDVAAVLADFKNPTSVRAVRNALECALSGVQARESTNAILHSALDGALERIEELEEIVSRLRNVVFKSEIENEHKQKRIDELAVKLIMPDKRDGQ